MSCVDPENCGPYIDATFLYLFHAKPTEGQTVVYKSSCGLSHGYTDLLCHQMYDNACCTIHIFTQPMSLNHNISQV